MGLRHLIFARAGFAAAAAFSAALIASASSAAAQTTIRVALDGGFTGPSAPFLIALDRGYYRSEKLDVTIEVATAPPDSVSRVASGAVEFAVADINTVARYRDQHPAAPIKAVFMVYNKPPYAIIARKSRGISTPKDLEDKKVGAPTADAANAQWPLFAKLNDIDVSKVKIENVAAAVREPMLAAGQVDAVTGSSLSAYLNLKERGVPVDDLVIMPMADYGLHLYGDAIIVNTKFASENPEAVKAFLRAYLKGLKDTIRDPARAVESVIKRSEGAKKDVELERLRMAIRDNIVTEEVRTNGLGAVDTTRLANAINQLVLTFSFKKKPEGPDVFDASFLPRAAERRVNGLPRPG